MSKSKWRGEVVRDTFRFVLFVAFTFASSVAATTAWGQQVTVATPMHSVSAGFFQNNAVGFQLQHNSPHSRMFFNNNFGAVVPPFGGFGPGAQAFLGMRGRAGDLSWGLGLSSSQGSSLSSVTTTPMLTLRQGGFGFVGSTVTRPFVTRIVPVVNDRALHRARLVQQFDEAKTIVSKRRQLAAEKAAYEMQQLKRLSDERIAARRRASSSQSKTTSTMERPLILKPTTTSPE